MGPQRTYTLVVESGTIDAESFRVEVGALLAAGPGEHRLNGLSNALPGWRGTPLGDLSHESWAIPTVTELAELKLRAGIGRADDMLEVG